MDIRTLAQEKGYMKNRHNSSERNSQKKSKYDQEMPQSDTAEQQRKRTSDTKTIIELLFHGAIIAKLKKDIKCCT